MYGHLTLFVLYVCAVCEISKGRTTSKIFQFPCIGTGETRHGRGPHSEARNESGGEERRGDSSKPATEDERGAQPKIVVHRGQVAVRVE